MKQIYKRIDVIKKTVNKIFKIAKITDKQLKQNLVKFLNESDDFNLDFGGLEHLKSVSKDGCKYVFGEIMDAKGSVVYPITPFSAIEKENDNSILVWHGWFYYDENNDDVPDLQCADIIDNLTDEERKVKEIIE